MDKIAGLTGVMSALRQFGSGRVDKSNSPTGKKASAGSASKKISIEKHIAMYVASLSSANSSSNDLITAFVRGALTWEWGAEIESDPTFISLVTKVVDDIKGHAELKQQVAKFIEGFN